MNMEKPRLPTNSFGGGVEGGLFLEASSSEKPLVCTTISKLTLSGRSLAGQAGIINEPRTPDLPIFQDKPNIQVFR